MAGPVLPYGRQTMEDDDIAAVAEALRADFLTTGPTVAAFEDAFAETVGARHAVACANGTAALHLAMLGLEARAGERRLRPVLPVHLRGDAANLPALSALAGEAGAVLVEDAPHALGTTMS